jgi:hypothetical protein
VPEHDFSTTAALESDAADLRQQLAAARAELVLAAKLAQSNGARAETLRHENTQLIAGLAVAVIALEASEAERARLNALNEGLADFIESLDERVHIADQSLDFMIVRGGETCHWLHIAGTTESREIAGELEGFLELLDEEGMLDDDDEAGGDAGKWETN